MANTEATDRIETMTTAGMTDRYLLSTNGDCRIEYLGYWLDTELTGYSFHAGDEREHDDRSEWEAATEAEATVLVRGLR